MNALLDREVKFAFRIIELTLFAQQRRLFLLGLGELLVPLGKKLLERGAIAVALEAVYRPRAKEARASR